jgi:hypothetical protein
VNCANKTVNQQRQRNEFGERGYCCLAILIAVSAAIIGWTKQKMTRDDNERKKAGARC